MDVWKNGLTKPLHGGLHVGMHVGETIVQGIRHSTVEVPGRVLRTIDSRRLAAHLIENYVADEQSRIVEEIVECQDDFPLVDNNVVNFVLISAKHSTAMARQGTEVTEPYIEEIEEIMTDHGVRELTVVKAVANARHIMPRIVTRDVNTPLW